MSYVYFIAYGDPEWRNVLPFVKVGFTNDLEKRMRAFATGSPIPLVIAGFIETDAPEELESWIHGNLGLCGSRVNGEWFKINNRSMEIIDMLGDQIKENRIKELFDFSSNNRDDPAYLRNIIMNCNERIRALEDENDIMRNRLIEVDPACYKYINKKSIKPGKWATYKRLNLRR